VLKPQIFKPGDIRGMVVGDEIEWDTDGAEHLGAAFAKVFDLEGKTFVLGHDMRQLGPELSAAFAEGAMRLGAHVIFVSLVSTDELWYCSGVLDLPGVQITASHNPGEYNGVKFCRSQARPITPALLEEIHKLALEDLPSADRKGTLTRRDMLSGYVDHLHSLVDLDGIKPMKVVVDAGNGMAGLTTPAVLGPLVEVIGLYLDLDGTFPNHLANPLIPENLRDAQAAVIASEADLGLVFDGDADRCFIIDEQGQVVSPAAVTALIAQQALAKEPGGTIVINSITSRAVAEAVRKAGGKTVVSPVGHSFMKAKMAEHNAVFGGEHSAHYYFRDFWGADTGMLAALNVLGILGRTDKTMSELTSGLKQYVVSGELNTQVSDPKAIMAEVEEIFDGMGQVDHSDGLMISTPHWWVSVRMSNTEPLLRLNVEAEDQQTMEELRDRALAVIRKEY
jgi:phosphomannomutase